MNLRLLALAALLPTTLAAHSATLLVHHSDPAGDDHGDGRLIYPRETIYEAGDLDLRSLRISEDGDQLVFEITLNQPVRHPSSVKSGTLGGEDLSVFARRGFYAFNLDIYLDTDRRNGSGQQTTLPGRGGRIDPAHAWERAIVLTPRPELMHRQLREAVAEAGGSDEAGADNAVNTSVHFVREVRVRGRSLSFSVPQRFVGAQALKQASMVAAVTAAQLTIPAELARSTRWSSQSTATGDGPGGRISLGVAAPEAGQPAASMGWKGGRPPPTAIVDLLAPTAQAQASQLESGRLVGIGGAAPADVSATGPNASPADAPAALLSRALVLLSGHATPPSTSTVSTRPAPEPAAAMAPAGGAAPASAAAAAAAHPSAATPATPAGAGAAAAASATPVATGASASPAGAVRPPQSPAPRRDPAFLEEQELRLKSLRRLRDSGLISEEEYQRKRKEVIDAL